MYDMETILQKLLTQDGKCDSNVRCMGPFKSFKSMYRKFKEALVLEFRDWILACRENPDDTNGVHVLFASKVPWQSFVLQLKNRKYMVIYPNTISEDTQLPRSHIRLGSILPFQRMFQTLEWGVPLKLSTLLEKKSRKKRGRVRLISNSLDSSLNASQKECISGIVDTGSSRVSLINGPPGTGKTRVLVEIVKLLSMKPGPPILVTSECNDTVRKLADEIRMRVPKISYAVLGSIDQVSPALHSGLISNRIQQFSRFIKRVNQCCDTLPKPKTWLSLAKEATTFTWGESIAKVIRSQAENLCEDDIMEMLSMQLDLGLSNNVDAQVIRRVLPTRTSVQALEDWIFKNVHVIFGTLCATGDRRYRKWNFPVVVIDEAGHSIVPKILNAISSETGHLVLAGDVKQSDPLVTSILARKAGLNISIMERVLKCRPESPDNYFLDTQYRMSTDIARFPLQYVYNGTVKDGLNKTSGGYMVIDARTCRERKVGTSYSNIGEVRIVLDKLREVTNRNITIITPYLAQVRLFEQEMQRHGLSNVYTVKTIDEMQGSEADAIAVSLVRTKHAGFVNDFKRLNVALTRAKYWELVIGHCGALSRTVPMLKCLFEDALERGLLQRR